jgi:chromosome segregation ATPase
MQDCDYRSEPAKVLAASGTVRSEIQSADYGPTADDLSEENRLVKNRITIELKERCALVALYRDLNEEYAESREALQSTGIMLSAVQLQISELRGRNERREHQLEKALELNKSLSAKFFSLGRKLDDTQANSNQLLMLKEQQISNLKEQQLQLRAEISRLQSDNIRLVQVTAEQKDNIQSKDVQIEALEKNNSVLINVLGQIETVSAAMGIIKQQSLATSPDRAHPRKVKSWWGT